MSLPFAFTTRLNSIPNTVPYLSPDPQRIAQWQTRLATTPNHYRVGLVWAGRPLHQYDRERSIHLDSLAPLAHIPEIEFFTLQKGEAANETKTLPPGFNLVDHTPLLNDFADTAALISQLDLVISVDTSVAHLAAAMGKPTWILLAYVPDWRWLLDRDDSPWYPTIRLFRQPARGDWVSVIQRITQRFGEE